LSRFKNPGKIFNQWGGPTTLLFTYLHFSQDLLSGLLVGLLPLIREDFGLNYLQVGLLISAYSITSGFSQLPGGWLGDRISRKVVIAIGLGGISLAAIAIGLSSTFYPMLFILIIMGIFAGAYHPSAISMLSGSVGEANRGRVIALHMIGGSIGFALSPVFGGLIANVTGWRFAFIILAIPALAAVPVALTKLKYQKRPATGKPASPALVDEPKHKPINIRQVLRPIIIICILAILTQFMTGCAMSFIPLYLVDKHNIAPASAAMLLSIIRGGGIVGSLLGGWLSDKWGRRKTVYLAIAVTGPFLYLLTILPFNPLLIALFVTFGVVMYVRSPAIQTLLMDTIPPQLRATVLGVYFFFGMEGKSVIQPVAGYFMDILGIGEVFTIIALISVALAVVALFLAIKPRLRR